MIIILRHDPIINNCTGHEIAPGHNSIIFLNWLWNISPDSVTTLTAKGWLPLAVPLLYLVMRLSVPTFVPFANVLNPQLVFNRNTWGNIFVMTSNFKKSQFWIMYDIKMCKTQVLMLLQKTKRKWKKSSP